MSKQVVSVRIDAELAAQLRRVATERSMNVSELLRQAALDVARDIWHTPTPKSEEGPKQEIRHAIEQLRARRDAFPTVPGVDRSCGNLGVHDEVGCWYRHCGRPVQMWSKAAWDVEFAARALERRLEAPA